MTRVLVAFLALLALVGCGGSSSSGDSSVDVPSPTAEPDRASSGDDVVRGLGRSGFDPAAIYDREAQGVVTIISVFGEGGLGSLLSGGDEGDEGESGVGSGIVLDKAGEIVTNAHVVTTGDVPNLKKARQLFVQFGDGNRVEAQLRGYDPHADVALIKVDPEGLDLDPLPLGDSDDVGVGSPVAAMGSPFGEAQSLSVGVVSAIDRDIQGLTNFAIGNAIQTDAAINPGNSGGPLVNARGQVIGLNQQIRTRSGGGEGVGFALPSNLAKRSLDQLRSTGKAEYAYLGVTSTSVYPQLAAKFGLPVKEGAWLQEVSGNTPGARAGLRGGGSDQVQFQAGAFNPGGDVVVQLGDTKIRTSSDLTDAIDPYEPGDKVPVVYYRGDDRRTGTVTVGTRPLAPPTGG